MRIAAIGSRLRDVYLAIDIRATSRIQGWLREERSLIPSIFNWILPFFRISLLLL